MSYPGVGDASRTCEICGGEVRGIALRRGGVLDRCAACGHLHRDLARCPAHHRDLAYGGEPHLDRVRLDLTYRELVREGRPGSVFEIGYGTGEMLRRFLDDGATVAGVDPDQLLLDVDPQVRAAGDLRSGGVEDLGDDGGDGGDGATRYDLVYGIHVLEHVRDPAAALAAALRLTRPGGRAVFLTPAGDSSGVERYGSAWWMLEDPTHVRFFTASSLSRAARDAGFVDVRVRRLLLDSLSVDAASTARAMAWRPRPEGVLGGRGVLAAAAFSVPAVVATRLARPLARPTLQLLARRP